MMQRYPLIALYALLLAACGTSGGVSSDSDASTDTGETSDIEGVDTQTDTTAPDTDDTLGELGELCDVDLQCLSGYCVDLVPGDGGGLCSQRCTDDNCPTGFDCITLAGTGGDAERICLPNELCIDVDEDGFGFGGACRGSDCVDSDPTINPGADELCDGVDQDCDGDIDENPVDAREDCETGFEGVCGPGRTTCESGGLTCTSLTAPSEEVCNGQDDDCDGIVDNGLTCGCDDGFYLCGDTCLANGLCCEDADCGEAPWICDADGACACDAGFFACGDLCVADGTCCENADCDEGFVCSTPGDACTCRGGTYLCGDVCVSDRTCCTDAECDDGYVCTGPGESCVCDVFGHACDLADSGDPACVEATVYSEDYDHFMHSANVGADQDVIAVGLPGLNEVQIYRRVAGIWTPEQTLDGDAVDQGLLGHDVQVLGDMLTARSWNGDLYVYGRDAAGIWQHQATLDTNLNPSWDQSALGDGFIVTTDYRVGETYVYDQSSGNWAREATFYGAIEDDWSRMAVAASGTTFMVGNPERVYVYDLVAASWTPTQTLERAGKIIRIDGDVAVIERDFYDRIDGVWVEDTTVSPCGEPAPFFDHYDLEIDETTGDGWFAIANSDSEAGVGEGWVYRRVDGEWVDQTHLTPPVPMINLHMGNTLAVAGSTVVAGTNNEGTGDRPRFYIWDF